MTVTFADPTTGAAMAAGQNVVLISSGDAATIGASFGASTVPVMVFGNSYFATLGMTASASSNKGTIDSAVMVTVTDITTSLAAGLMNGYAFVAINPNRDSSLYWGTPAAGAIKVASSMGAANQGIVFAYEKGAMTATMVAPARRVAFAWKTNVLKDLTVDAFKLFSAALDWTATAPP
jgi:hypothetical protein